MSSPQALQLAVTALNAGELAKAELVLARLEREDPAGVDVLNLLALLRRRQGRNEEAVALYERSLKVRENQPHVHNSLGVTLASIGRSREAEQSYLRALALEPLAMDARYNLALLHTELARWQDARQSLESVIAAQPEHGLAHEALGIVLRELGDKSASLEAASKAAALRPQSPGAHHNLGQSLMALGRYEDAADAYRRAVTMSPELDPSWIGLGHAYRAQGNAAEAKAAYQAALNANPANPDAHRLFNEMVWQTGDVERYLQSYPLTLQQRPADHRLRLAYANELLKIGQHDEARAELDRALNTGGGSGEVLDAMARALSLAGDYKEASRFHRRAIESGPDSVAFFQNFGESLLKAAEHDEAHRVTSQGLQRFPLEQGLLAVHTTAQRLAGDPDYDRLAAYERIPNALTVEPPPGYADIESFCADLKVALDRLHGTKAHPTDQTLRGGTQTFGALFTNQDPLIQAFVVQLRKAIAQFIEATPDDPTHPFLKRKSLNFDFSGSWSVRLASGGFHTNHFHPKGWISSAFYVDVPEVAAKPGSQEGWFKMGETNLELGEREVIHRLVQPKVGRLVLFPSYFWHGTVPFNGPSHRTTIAFDVVPR